MGIFDLFKKKELTKTYGVTGTSVSNGLIDEEYNKDLLFPDSIEIYDQMRKSDATVKAVLKAIKEPLISAKWQIHSASENESDMIIKEFIEKNLFENIKFYDFLREALCFLDFGFYYFEKIFILNDGKIEWKELSPRIPKSHYLWSFQNNKVWIDGHPQGVTQLINSYIDETVDKSTTREIPWSKLVLFVNEKEGSNFEGVSILRSAYKHWYYKDLLYKIESIACERYGVGTPVAGYKQGINSKDLEKINEFLKNIRSNEKAYGTYPFDSVGEIKIMTPDGNGVNIQPPILHHDRKIYDSILAGFLNLSSGDGGSNALSKDQSSFFLRGLQGVGKYICDIINEQIRELVDLNFSNIEEYPKLNVSDIGSISMDEHINAIKTAVDGGMIDLNNNDKNDIRGILKLSSVNEEEINENEEKEKMEEDKNDDDMKEKEMKEFSEKKYTPTEREKVFTKNITEFEKYLNSKYKEAEKIVNDWEKEIQEGLVKLYDEAPSERVDGVICLIYDKKQITKCKNFVEKVSKKLEEKLIDGDLQKQIFDEAIKKANETVEMNNKFFAYKAKISKGQIDTFIEGYKSNMQGVIYNEKRRVLENITLDFGSESSVELAKEKVGEITVNKNILGLSFITHPRAEYKYIIYNEAQAEGFTLFKTLVPTDKLPNVISRPFGITSSFVFKIQTASQINKTASATTGGATSEAVTGLGLHHGSFEYYYPIQSSDIDVEEEIARQQRIELQNEIEKNNLDNNQ